MLLVSALAPGVALSNTDADYAEELLDLVVQHCRAGDVAQALAIRQADYIARQMKARAI